MVEMSFKEMALSIGKGKDYFYLLRRSNKKLFNYMYVIGKGNLVNGYSIYKNSILNTRNDLADIYFDLKELGGISAFSRYLAFRGYFSHENSFVDVLPEAAFSTSDRMGFDVYLKYRAIVKEYGQYKKTRNKN